eukprot:985252-Ditylum_brightwellii.AAC.1
MLASLELFFNACIRVTCLESAKCWVIEELREPVGQDMVEALDGGQGLEVRFGYHNQPEYDDSCGVIWGKLERGFQCSNSKSIYLETCLQKPGISGAEDPRGSNRHQWPTTLVPAIC